VRDRVEVGRGKLIVGVIIGVVSVLGNVAQLVFLFEPDLKPVARGQVRATAKIKALDLRVTAREYAERPGGSDTCYGKEASKPKRIGVVLYVEFKIVGFKNRHVNVRCAMYGAASRRALRQYTRPISEGLDLRPDSPNDVALAQVWLPLPPSKRPHFARLELYEAQEHGDYTLLSFADSPPF
jgi:hypothetical protein